MFNFGESEISVDAAGLIGDISDQELQNLNRKKNDDFMKLEIKNQNYSVKVIIHNNDVIDEIPALVWNMEKIFGKNELIPPTPNLVLKKNTHLLN